MTLPSVYSRHRPRYAQALQALDAPCAQARQSFSAWMHEATRARAAVEARARTAVADCYRFGLQALEDPASFETFCQGLGIRQTRSDRAGNPFIRVVKAVFGQEVEDGNGGPPRWEWLSDSQVNKYATVLFYAQQRGIPPDGLVPWLSEDWSASGEVIPMSISRRLREARAAAQGQDNSQASLAAPSPAVPRGQAVLAALDDLPETVDMAPLTLQGLGDDEAAMILTLGGDEGVRLGNLPEDLMVQVLATVSRYYRRADADPGEANRPLSRLAALLRQALPLAGPRACLRLVNTQDACSLLLSAPHEDSGSAGMVVRMEIPPLDGVPRRRVFAMTAHQARAFVQGMGQVPSHQPGSPAPDERFQETNFARSGGLLEQRLVVDGGSGSQTFGMLEVPGTLVGEPIDGLALVDLGVETWDGCCLLEPSDLAALARLESRARRWKELHTTRTGRTVTRRASRIIEVIPDDAGGLGLSLRRGPSDGVAVCLPLTHGSAQVDRIGRSALGQAAQVLLKRRATEQVILLIASGRLWMLSGQQGETGERITIAIPAVDRAGKTVVRGLREGRFETDAEPFVATLARIANRLGVPLSRVGGT